MSDDAILKIMEYVVLGEGAIELSPTVKKRALEAAQQIRQFIDKEIIGSSELAIEDRPGQTNDNMARNGLRNEQRKKLREPME
jgi:hypothetical protein